MSDNYISHLSHKEVQSKLRAYIDIIGISRPGNFRGVECEMHTVFDAAWKGLEEVIRRAEPNDIVTVINELLCEYQQRVKDKND